MTTSNKFNKFKQKKLEDMDEQEKLQFLEAEYNKRNTQSFRKTAFYKKRLMTVIALFVGILVIASVLPKNNTNTEINLFSYVFLIMFFALIAFIDQLLLGAYLHKKHIRKYKLFK